VTCNGTYGSDDGWWSDGILGRWADAVGSPDVNVAAEATVNYRLVAYPEVVSALRPVKATTDALTARPSKIL
jgi:hypothetical protein